MTYFEEKFMKQESLEKMTYGSRWIGDDQYVQYLFKYENGFGASVVKGKGTYGYQVDSWELAVIKWANDNTWDVTDNTPITGDVLGYLSSEEVLDTLEQIKNL